MSIILIITSNVRPFSCPIICTDIYYRPQRSWGKVIFSQACVILFTGGDLPQCMLGYHTPPWTRHPPDQAPTRPRTPQDHAPPPRCRACWEIWSMHRWYASYWNAILFTMLLFSLTPPTMIDTISSLADNNNNLFTLSYSIS